MYKRVLTIASIIIGAILFTAANKPQKVYCSQCGRYWPSIQAMNQSNCIRHPAGCNKGPHKLYRGSEKKCYYCRYCGRKWLTIADMTNLNCEKHPNGRLKGRHCPL